MTSTTICVDWLELFNGFIYLGSLVTSRTASARVGFAKLRNSWCRNDIWLSLKRVGCSAPFVVFFLTVEHARRLLAFDHRYLPNGDRLVKTTGDQRQGGSSCVGSRLFSSRKYYFTVPLSVARTRRAYACPSCSFARVRQGWKNQHGGRLVFSVLLFGAQEMGISFGWKS